MSKAVSIDEVQFIRVCVCVCVCVCVWELLYVSFLRNVFRPILWSSMCPTSVEVHVPHPSLVSFWRLYYIMLCYVMLCYIILHYIDLLGHTTQHTKLPQPGIKPAPSAVEAWSLNHWTTREVPEPQYMHFITWYCLRVLQGSVLFF